MATLQEASVKLNEYVKTVKKMGKASVADACKEFFGKYPEARLIMWSQYIPGFNDGDVCEFHMADINLVVDVADKETGKSLLPSLKEMKANKYEGYLSDNGTFNEVCFKPTTPEMAKDWTKLVKLLNNEDLMERMFGANATVRVWCDGKVEVDEYDCGY